VECLERSSFFVIPLFCCFFLCQFPRQGSLNQTSCSLSSPTTPSPLYHFFHCFTEPSTEGKRKEETLGSLNHLSPRDFVWIKSALGEIALSDEDLLGEWFDHEDSSHVYFHPTQDLLRDIMRSIRNLHMAIHFHLHPRGCCEQAPTEST